MESREIENADGARSLSAAAKSLAIWYQGECGVIAGARRLARAEIAAGRDVAETEQALSDLEEQDRQLQLGWQNSSVRRRIEQRAEPPAAAGGVERRAVLAASSGPHLASGARATGTGSPSTSTATKLGGYGAVFNKWADIGYFREQIAPGAFAQAIKTSDVRCLFNHDTNFIYGRSTANTLELSEDRIGLRFVCHLLPFDAASYALARRVDRMDISGCSFSFTVGKDTWKLAQRPGELDERTIMTIGQLFDIGPVTYPAYSQTTVQAIFEKAPGRSAEYDLGVGNDEFYAELDQLDEQIERDDRLLAQQRERDRKFDYQEMGRTIREVDHWLALRS